MRVVYDEEQDEARIYFSKERQSREAGGTYLVLVNDEEKPRPRSVEVQLGFEGRQRLLFIIVSPASEVLPAALLAEAERPSTES